jgi:DNA repair photolyase
VHRCTFCYVRAFEARADRESADGCGRTVRVKTNLATLLHAELARPAWSGKLVALGTSTDPYQPAEATYRLTRACLIELARARTPAAVATRGPMVLRDRDVLQELEARAGVTVTVSLPTLDMDIWRRTEPATAPPPQRLRAVAGLVGAGLRAGVALAPLLPGLTDGPEGIAAVVTAAREAGATFLWWGMLRLPAGTREHFLEALSREWPELLPRYLALYRAGGVAAPPSVRTAAGATVERERSRWGSPTGAISPSAASRRHSSSTCWRSEGGEERSGTPGGASAAPGRSSRRPPPWRPWRTTRRSPPASASWPAATRGSPRGACSEGWPSSSTATWRSRPAPRGGSWFASTSERLTAAGEAEEMIMRGRGMPGWLRVAPERVGSRERLASRVGRGLRYAASLPSER